MSPSGEIIGHEFQRDSLRRLLGAERLPQTLMLNGTRGIGKRLVARELAREIFCCKPSKASSACGACQSCALFEAGNHPDFIQIEALNREDWNLDAIRRVLYSLSLASYLGGARVVLINDAEYLSDQASNALLKSLEEPRAGTYFILVSANPSRLPPTLLSRCQSWFFERLTDEQTGKVLETHPPAGYAELPAADRKDMVMLAEGSPGTVADLTGALDLWRELGARATKVFEGDVKEALDLAAEFGKDRERLRVVLQLLRILGRRNMRQVSGATAGAADARRKWAALLANGIAAERLIFERNLSGSYVLAHIFLALVDERELNSFTALTNSASFLETVTR